jgi:hypothetical protein
MLHLRGNDGELEYRLDSFVPLGRGSGKDPQGLAFARQSGANTAFGLRNETPMRRYFFDLREGDSLAVDEEGVELASVEAVQEEAARSLAEMAKEVTPGTSNNGGHPMAIEVRDDNGPIMKVLFVFEADRRLH